MKIINNCINKPNFTGKSPNDSTYWLMKNPEKASDMMERGFADDFIKRHPNWEKDEELVHRLKQDTIKARAKGKIHSQWHEFDTFPGVSVPFCILVSVLSISLLIKKKNLTKYEKTLFTFGAICSPLLAIDSLKYIFTGRNLFEKKQNNK